MLGYSTANITSGTTNYRHAGASLDTKKNIIKKTKIKNFTSKSKQWTKNNQLTVAYRLILTITEIRSFSVSKKNCNLTRLIIT